MTAATPNRFGSINGGVDKDALFLKVFSGEVLTSFEQSTAMMGRHAVRTISNGKSAQFPVSGRAGASYHVPGNEILGGAINHNEKTIVINDLLVSSVFLSNIDEAKSHWDVRAMHSTEVGRALAQTMDKHLLQVGVLAARTATANVADGGYPAGTRIEEAVLDDFYDGDKLATAIYAAAEQLDENDVPQEDRYAFLEPRQYYALVQSSKAINRDFNTNNGSFAKGNVFEVAGIEIVKTNNLPRTDVTTGTLLAGTGDRYLGDFTDNRGLVMHKSAIGTVKLMELASEMEYDMRRQGTLVLSKYAFGHGVLRPESAVELFRYTA